MNMKMLVGSVTLLLIVYCNTGQVNAKDICWSEADRGSSYRGDVWKTESGIICQPWGDQIPHSHNYTDMNHPDLGLDENYCRNPDNKKERPWCYTTNPAIVWEYCNVPKCTTTCWDTNDQGIYYRGKVSRTITGKTCQNWGSQTPHSHQRTPTNFPSSGLDVNFCRNPDPEYEAPWCFTDDPKQRWEYCFVPTCAQKIPQTFVGCWKAEDHGARYRGSAATTVSGKTCLPWREQTRYKTERDSEVSKWLGLLLNRCRNPDGSESPWCYVEENGEILKEKCDIPKCTVECWDETSGGSNYRGTVSTTISGRRCQKWTAQYPHHHDKNSFMYPESGLSENYCRNPDGEEMPWCYTTDRSKRWEYCAIPSCSCKKLTDFYGCWDPSDKGASYDGIASTTISGKRCQNWPSLPFSSPLSSKNYCRNPSGEKSPWCNTDVENNQWEPCCLTSCVASCWDSKDGGASYRGTVAKTRSGKSCQRWDAQYPHQHKRTENNYPYSGLKDNYCRNPDGEPSPWCYTTDPGSRWEFCDIPKCAPGCWNPLDKGVSYRGFMDITETGKTCLYWNKFELFSSGDRYSGLTRNYCRNPSGMKERPWCFTLDQIGGWEYCSIPACFQS